ncbi:large ribosomal subunit protein bL34m [Trichomonascus vanleenenianus]|uniref:mitochondrial 54S ribosomal protein bL34m MRX14 n=1 Tax=Trichomonascus vanleenenianus TaxID=2268995 RepID=UPI003ECB87AA
MFAVLRRTVARQLPSTVRSFSLLSGRSALSALRAGPTAAPSFNSITNSLTPFTASQVRWKAMGNNYQPSTVRRKRRLGFLARMRSRTGRRIIARRKTKGRWYLSH